MNSLRSVNRALQQQQADTIIDDDSTTLVPIYATPLPAPSPPPHGRLLSESLTPSSVPYYGSIATPSSYYPGDTVLLVGAFFGILIVYVTFCKW
jgi:hypothetical protein